LPVDLADGKPVIAFEATKMDGKDRQVSRGDYKGKIVMIDFLGNVVRALHGRGA